MSFLRLSFVWIVCGAAVCTQARADDLTAAKPEHPRTSAAKVRPHKLAPSQPDGLSGVKFSNPYASPEGTTQTKRSEFLVAPYPTPTEPKGGLSITAGRAGPDDLYTGGFKLRF
jgi:hypothetical protein